MRGGRSFKRKIGDWSRDTWRWGWSGGLAARKPSPRALRRLLFVGRWLKPPRCCAGIWHGFCHATAISP